MQVKDTDSEVVEALGMSTFPALVVITADGELVPYEGAALAGSRSSRLDSPCHYAPVESDACVTCTHLCNARW